MIDKSFGTKRANLRRSAAVRRIALLLALALAVAPAAAFALSAASTVVKGAPAGVSLKTDALGSPSGKDDEAAGGAAEKGGAGLAGGETASSSSLQDAPGASQGAPDAQNSSDAQVGHESQSGSDASSAPGAPGSPGSPGSPDAPPDASGSPDSSPGSPDAPNASPVAPGAPGSPESQGGPDAQGGLQPRPEKPNAGADPSGHDADSSTGSGTGCGLGTNPGAGTGCGPGAGSDAAGGSEGGSGTITGLDLVAAAPDPPAPGPSADQTSGFAWTYTTWLQEPGECAIDGWNKVQPENGVASVPAEIDGLKVTSIVTVWPMTASSFSDLEAQLDLSAASNLRTIGDYAFRECNGITGSIVVPEGVTSIGKAAFQGSEGFTELSLPKSLTSIGEFACQYCYGLTTLSLPGGNLTSINTGAFDYCKNLSGTIVIPPGVTSIKNNAFFTCPKITGLVLPEGLVQIDAFAFQYDSGIGSLTLPESLASIGWEAFGACGLESVQLPQSLTFLATIAFDDNRMAQLALPDNPALDKPYNEAAEEGVGEEVMRDQKISDPVWYLPEGDKGEVALDRFCADRGVNPAFMSQLTLQSQGVGYAPENPDWQGSLRPRFPLAALEAPGASLTYDYEVRRPGNPQALSTGNVVLKTIAKASEYRFRVYYGDFGSDRFDEYSQWVLPGDLPLESTGAGASFGHDRPGYHTVSGAYSAQIDAGWRTGDGSGGAPGTPEDPASRPAEANKTYRYYNRWIGNAYRLSFDDEFARMVQIEPGLGLPDPAGGANLVPNPKLVHGDTPATGPSEYGKAAEPSPNGFVMGGFQFDGWASAPDLAEADRAEGKNYFAEGSPLFEPTPVTVRTSAGLVQKPTPDEGDEVVLFAQWKPRDLSAPDQIASSVMIPARLSLEQAGSSLWSVNPAFDPADPASDKHAVTVSLVSEDPGAYWPQGDHRIGVSVVRPAPGEPLLALASEADGDVPHAVDVLKEADSAPYSPDPAQPGGAPVPLLSLRPVAAGDDKPAATFDHFYLKAQDPPWDFAASALYEGTLRFRIEWL